MQLMAASKFFNGIDLQNQKVINGADGSAATDLVTKQQLDNAVAGLAWKQPVRAATTANGALATAYANGQSVDGVTLATGDRILVKNQSAGAENGIYVVAATGAPTRTSDADTATELNSASVYVTSGTVNADKAFTQTVDPPITVNTTALVFAQVGGGTSYTGSNGVLLTGSNFTAVADPTPGDITVSSTGIKVTPGAYPKKFAQDVGALTASTPLTITHNLNTLDVVVETRLNSSGEIVDLGAVVTSVNAITVQSGSAQSAAAFRVVVIG